jgi:hypothetical protein
MGKSIDCEMEIRWGIVLEEKSQIASNGSYATLGPDWRNISTKFMHCRLIRRKDIIFKFLTLREVADNFFEFE